MIEIVYQSRSNTVRKQVFIDGEPANFFPVTRMTLQVGGVLLDSAVQSGVFDWSQGAGFIDFTLGAQSLPLGLHQAVLVAYDNDHPSGQVLAHPAGPKLTFRVVR